ncbi:MAG: hypothetical protein E7J35_05215 [Veillonella sp.]|nr:hypothetical protein [Veillonella sp.]MDU6979315.1 hypothetical protein [Veillonella sp.]MDU7910108.1 hypothetical protein [Veillonella parvula]MDU7927937.1 hypothetical protein [Veillonella sp.]MDU8007427.1 hypothetical protein [Veillonella sp.]
MKIQMTVTTSNMQVVKSVVEEVKKIEQEQQVDIALTLDVQIRNLKPWLN